MGILMLFTFSFRSPETEKWRVVTPAFSFSSQMQKCGGNCCCFSVRRFLQIFFSHQPTEILGCVCNLEVGADMCV